LLHAKIRKFRCDGQSAANSFRIFSNLASANRKDQARHRLGIQGGRENRVGAIGRPLPTAVSPVNLASFVRHFPSSIVLRTNQHRAVIEARKTVGKFITALKHPAPGQQDFEVKKPFTQGDQVEHIWLSDVRFVGNRFQGQVDNQPRKIRGLKLGQLVSVNPNEISDWLYVDNGKLVGGYTVRAHYNELSPQQKQEFDREADFKIGKQ
jgi:uncharacterized protein YegJ (DUF2314 family)